MAPKLTPCSDLGSVEDLRGGFMAQARGSDRAGVAHDTSGSWRCKPHQAEANLTQIRDGSGSSSHKGSSQQVTKTAAQLDSEACVVAAHEVVAQKEHVMQRSRKGEESVSASVASSQSADSYDAEAEEKHSYHEGVSEIGDVNEPWQDIEIAEDGSILGLMPNTQPTRKYDPSLTMFPANAKEATEALCTLLPSKSNSEDLELLLARRADPNVTSAGGFTILRRVLYFASPDNVVAMRAALLAHGAVENDADIAYWERRRRADEADQAWLRKFHDDDRMARDYEQGIPEERARD